jgi:ankyrin repeat protein
MKIQFNHIFLIGGLLSALHGLSAMQEDQSSCGSGAQGVVSVDQEVPEISAEQRQVLGQQLFELINTGNNDEVKNLLEQGAHVDVVDADNSTPLFYAIRASNLMALKLCLKHGADVFHVNSRGGIPYFSATNRNTSQEILNTINFYEFATINKYGSQAVAQQISKSRMNLAEKQETIKRLKKLILSYQFLDSVIQGNYDLALSFMSEDININVVDGNNSTALFHALRADVKNHSFISLILYNGADVFHVNNNGGIPYHSACKHGADQEIIELIQYFEKLTMRHGFDNVIARLEKSLGEAVREQTIDRLTQMHVYDDTSLTLFEKIYGVSQGVDYSARYTDFPGK